MDDERATREGRLGTQGLSCSSAYSLLPKDDELLCSWMMRIAHLTGDAPYRVALKVLNSKIAWTRDIDRVFSALELSAASQRVGYSPDGLKQLCLRERFPTVGCWKAGYIVGLLAVGVFHRERHLHGLQFCSACLKEDEPYFRQPWRLTGIVGCTRHECRLRDACPNCGSPVVLHRTCNARLADCHCCGSDLSDAKTYPLSRTALNYQLSFDVALQRGTLSQKSDWMNTTHAIEMTHCLWQILRMPFAGERLGSALEARAESSMTHLERPIRCQSVSRVDSRQTWLPLLWQVAENGQSAVIDICDSASITPKAFLNAFRGRPVSEFVLQTSQRLRTPNRTPRSAISKSSFKYKRSTRAALFEIGMEKLIEIRCSAKTGKRSASRKMNEL